MPSLEGPLEATTSSSSLTLGDLNPLNDDVGRVPPFQGNFFGFFLYLEGLFVLFDLLLRGCLIPSILGFQEICGLFDSKSILFRHFLDSFLNEISDPLEHMALL